MWSSEELARTIDDVIHAQKQAPSSTEGIAPPATR